jgi:Co/Zn/Cd efflux system component
MSHSICEVTINMSGGCNDNLCTPDPGYNTPRWRQALWIALGINAAMFLVEIIAGVAAGSVSLQADAIDFLGDSGNYAISLAVAGMALTWRARSALLKGWTLALFGIVVVASSLWHAYAMRLPDAETMGTVATLALIANVGVALLLYRFREGDSNMRSVWICSRNDAISNLAVLAAALGVFGTRTAWPDLIVAAIMAGLAISGAWQIIRQANGELRGVKTSATLPIATD